MSDAIVSYWEMCNREGTSLQRSMNFRLRQGYSVVLMSRRDKGRCVKCGVEDELYFDHILPFSKGGTSNTAENIQILCARHNLEKRDKIGA